MAVELTRTSIDKLCNGTFVSRPVVQLLGYETIQTENNETNYRLVLSDGDYMNSYFFLSEQLNNLITKQQVKYGTILRIDKYVFMDGENVANNSPRWIVFIQKITILIHRDVFGNPLPLMNIEKKKKPLVNLNVTSSPCRKFNSPEHLEEGLINAQDLNNLPNGHCSFVLKLTLSKKYPIVTHSFCKIFNMNMLDSKGVLVRVSAFNSLADKMNEIFQEKETYYITDATLKHNTLNELKLQPHSVIIQCSDQTKQTMQESDFITLLGKDPNTFCDLFGVCIDFGDIEVCCNSNTRTEIAKREILLIDTSMATITLKVWGENVNIFDKKFVDLPIVLVKQAVLKQFNGKKFFSMVKSSVLSINPDTPEAVQLKNWYKNTLEDLENDDKS